MKLLLTAGPAHDDPQGAGGGQQFRMTKKIGGTAAGRDVRGVRDRPFLQDIPHKIFFDAIFDRAVGQGTDVIEAALAKI